MQAVLPLVPPDRCRPIAYLRQHRKRVFQAPKLAHRNQESQALKQLMLRNQVPQAHKLGLRKKESRVLMLLVLHKMGSPALLPKAKTP